MTKKELIESLRSFNEDDVMILGDSKTGWDNIGEVKQEGSCICIMPNRTRPFSSDN